MKLIIRDTADLASQYVARYIVRRINDFGPTLERPFVLGLPTGSSPEAIYRGLVRAYNNGEISFANVVTFNMDEYVGLPEEHPESYHSFMYKHFFSHVDINPANVHLLNGNASDLVVECAAYEQRIREAGGIDLFLGGIGPDGHIAFNEPGSSLKSRTRVATLADDTIRANSRFFDNDIHQVPKQALTVGVQTVMEAREVVLIITGAHKAVALQKTVEGAVSQMWTASALQMHDEALIACDEDATGEMLVKTVKYFKSIEQIENQVNRAASTETNLRQQQQQRQKNLNEIRMEQWRGALAAKEEQQQQRHRMLRIDTKTTPHERDIERDIGELTPDSMSSRILDSAFSTTETEIETEMYQDAPNADLASTTKKGALVDAVTHNYYASNDKIANIDDDEGDLIITNMHSRVGTFVA